MTPEDVHHFRAIGRATGGGVDYFGGFSEVRGAQHRGGYDGELLRILGAEIIEAVHRASGDAQRLPGTNLDGRASCLSHGAHLGCVRMQIGEKEESSPAAKLDCSRCIRRR
jgi:hypothetical protein